jgi:hypothetical protein
LEKTKYYFGKVKKNIRNELLGCCSSNDKKQKGVLEFISWTPFS